MLLLASPEKMLDKFDQFDKWHFMIEFWYELLSDSEEILLPFELLNSNLRICANRPILVWYTPRLRRLNQKRSHWVWVP